MGNRGFLIRDISERGLQALFQRFPLFFQLGTSFPFSPAFVVLFLSGKFAHSNLRPLSLGCGWSEKAIYLISPHFPTFCPVSLFFPPAFPVSFHAFSDVFPLAQWQFPTALAGGVVLALAGVEACRLDHEDGAICSRLSCSSNFPKLRGD